MFRSHWYMFNSFHSWTIQLISLVRTRRPDRDAKQSVCKREWKCNRDNQTNRAKSKRKLQFLQEKCCLDFYGALFSNFKCQAMANAWIYEENDSKQTQKRRIDHDNDYWYQIVRVVTISNCLIGVNFVYSFLLCVNVQTSPLNHKQWHRGTLCCFFFQIEVKEQRQATSSISVFHRYDLQHFLFIQAVCLWEHR